MKSFGMVSVLTLERNIFQLFLITNIKYFMIAFEVLYLKTRSEIFQKVCRVIELLSCSCLWVSFTFFLSYWFLAHHYFLLKGVEILGYANGNTEIWVQAALQLAMLYENIGSTDVGQV